MDPSEQRQEALDLLQRTHQIYCGIKGKDITLIPASPPGNTDCETFIKLPIEDPEADIIHKHEWGHIFFKSNLRARQAFVDAYVAQLEQRIGGDSLWKEDVEGFIHILINALDDLRVCSLWAIIYPHSADLIQARWSRIVTCSGRYKRDIVMLLMAVGLEVPEHELERSEWDRYRPLLHDAVQKVLCRGFPACLVASRLILDSIIYDVVNLSLTGQDTPALPKQQLYSGKKPKLGGPRVNRADERENPDQAKQEDVLQRMVCGVSRLTRWDLQQGERANLMDTDRLPAGPDPDYKETQAAVQAALGVSSEDQVTYLLEQGQVDINKVLDSLRGAGTKLGPDEKMLRGLSQVSFRDVKPEMVEDLPLTIQDQRLVSTLRQSFVRLMDKKARVRSDSGSELDACAYIDMLLGDGDVDIFREESSSRGFSALILIDMSGSMRAKWETVSRACKVLAKSMRFPFSKFEVWGFSSDHEGRTSILRFENPERGYWGPSLRNIWGLTPLHLATVVGVRRLLLMPGTAQHLFVLTDGLPTHFGLRQGAMPSTQDLVEQAARAIREGRQKGVNTAGLVIGQDVPDEVADFMFGHSKFWSRVGDSEELFTGTVRLVKNAFTGYLRRR